MKQHAFMGLMIVRKSGLFAVTVIFIFPKPGMAVDLLNCIIRSAHLS